jgi:nicotinamidase-related amidase
MIGDSLRVEQERGRSIRTVVLGGIATNLGVESTARAAFDRGYELVFAENATSSISKEAHAFAIKNLLHAWAVSTPSSRSSPPLR